MTERHAHPRAIGEFTGRFTVHARNASLVVADGGVRLLFNGVEAHDLPATLDGVRVAEVANARPDALAARYFQLTSGGRTFRIRARSLQVHERAALYGKVIALPRFAPRKRMLWTLLLTLARFRWGQALIRRVAGRRAQ